MHTVKIRAEYKQFDGRAFVVVDEHIFDAEVLPKTYRITYDSGKCDLLKRSTEWATPRSVWRVNWGRRDGSFIRFEKLQEASV